MIYDVIVIGGGGVGLSTAYKILRDFPDKKLLVLEKENKVATHQTGHNSGVLHSGIYYRPNSLRAKNCFTGRKEMVAFAQEHGIDHDVCGKVIVATEEEELPFLEKIYSNGIANGTEEIKKIDSKEVKEIEPYCESIGGIFVGSAGIIHYPDVSKKLKEIINNSNSESKVKLGQKVKRIEKKDDYSIIHTKTDKFLGKYLIFCGGLQSDRLAKLDGVQVTDMRIIGFRGDYMDLTPQAEHKVRNLIYPVPNPKFPFLGVHFTRMIPEGIECGPNAVFVFEREGYKRTDFDLKDTWDALSYSGTWKLFLANMGFGIHEMRGAFNKKIFLKRVQKLIPSLTMSDIKRGRSGVRAMALGKDGKMLDDFKIEYKGNSIHVLNAPSPAATASLAIGEQIKDMAKERFGW